MGCVRDSVQIKMFFLIVPRLTRAFVVPVISRVPSSLTLIVR